MDDLKKERKKMLNKLIKLKPELKNEKKELFNKLVLNDNKKDKRNTIPNMNVENEYIFNVIVKNNNIYYIDKLDIVFNNKVEILGVYDSDNNNIILFNELIKKRSLIKNFFI